MHSCAAVSPTGKIPGGEGFPSLKSKSRPAGLNERWAVLGVCIFLVAITWMVFGQTLGHEFVNYDDNLYVYENPAVQKGLTWEGFRWALTYGQIGHWHPLTWFSHMLDCQLYGLNAGGHHLTNVLLHTASVVLLFLVLRRMMGLRPEKSIGATTPQAGDLWRSALVAAVFAIHPLRAESVAWVAERKDVLSGLFFMLTLWAYARYVTSGKWLVTRADPAPSPATRHPSLFYCLVVLFFGLGLLSKNMLVTLPFVLLLLDYWPLNRLSSFTPRVVLRLVGEKLPLFVLTVGSCVVTSLVPEKMTSGRLDFGLRLENAVVTYVTYLWQMIYPSGLACLYPNPVNSLPIWQVGGALGLLLAISGAAWVFRRTHPYIVVGWLWYVGMLIPVIGVVQISYYAHADRYTYLPQIGLYVLLTWGAAELCGGRRYCRLVLGGLAAVILAALIFGARTQASYWRNSESLWVHTLACTSDNYTAHNNLGDILYQKGKVDEAIAQYQTALKIKPDYPNAHYNLGNALLKKRRVDEAIGQYQTALKIKPNYAEARDNLGNVLFQRGRVDEAITQYQAALKIKPNDAKAHNNLGNALLQKGRGGEAITQYQAALKIKPAYPEALNNLARVLATFPQASLRNGGKAVELAQRANQLTGGGNPLILHTLAAAYAEVGRFGDAIRSAQKAIELAQAAGQKDLAAQLNSELKLYEAGLPFHEKSN